MASRRDQLQSYQFLTQRVISAFVMRETDPAHTPLRRGIGAVFGGVMVAVIVAAGFGIYGLITRVGGDAWRSDGAVVVERETGASFVYAGDRLHPTLNLTSAMLAAGRPHPAVFRVAANALTDVERGLPIGIPEAPGSLPPVSRQVGLPWTLCTQAGATAGGEITTAVTLLVAGAPAGHRGLGQTGMLVADPTAGATYLVWHGHRYQLRQPATVVPALFGAVVTATPAGTSWLNALPAGEDIGLLPVPDRGEPSPAVPGHEIGALLVAQTGTGAQHYLVVADGLVPITPLQEAIETAHFPTEPIPVSISEAAGAPRSERFDVPGDAVPAPRTPPELAAPGSGELLCAATSDPSAAPEVSLGLPDGQVGAANPTAAAGTGDPQLADRVHVPAGHVAVVRALTAPAAGAGTYHLVTDLGIAYPVPGPEVLPMLGYDPAGAVDVPAGLVGLIPPGPTLDPEAALQPVPGR